MTNIPSALFVFLRLCTQTNTRSFCENRFSSCKLTLFHKITMLSYAVNGDEMDIIRYLCFLNSIIKLVSKLYLVCLKGNNTILIYL